jgi:hypothetical protein
LKSCDILRLADLTHRQKTTNPEVIHKDFWFSPTAKLHGLSTGEETSRWYQTRNSRGKLKTLGSELRTSSETGHHADEPDGGLTSFAPLSIDPPPRRVELNREAYLPATQQESQANPWVPRS